MSQRKSQLDQLHTSLSAPIRHDRIPSRPSSNIAFAGLLLVLVILILTACQDTSNPTAIPPPDARQVAQTGDAEPTTPVSHSPVATTTIAVIEPGPLSTHTPTPVSDGAAVVAATEIPDKPGVENTAVVVTETSATVLVPTQSEKPAAAVPEATEPVNESKLQTTPEPVKISESDSGGFVIDHTSIALFEQIPDEYLAAAGNIPMVYADQSVGHNINQGLDCLASPGWTQAPAHCRRDFINANWEWRTINKSDYANGNVPAGIRFEADPVKYNRSNWTFEVKQAGWSNATKNFIEEIAPSYIDSKDVLSYQMTYLDVTEGSAITNSEDGYFSNGTRNYDVHDFEAYISKYPDKTFIFWTTSLSRNIGSLTSTEFNEQMRQYAWENDKILFDVADIEAHTIRGEPCYDNRDGVEYCTKAGICENYPDDGEDILAICQDYTTEIDGGHLGSVSSGKLQIAKAFWVLMARIAGWEG